MQAFFLFILIFFGVFGATLFLDFIYDTVINCIINRRKEKKRGGK